MSFNLKGDLYKVCRILISLSKSAWLLVLIFILGCATLEKNPPPTMTGSFSGNASDGRSINANFIQDESALTGTGSFDGRRFAISSVASWYGPAVLIFEDGSRTEVQIFLSPDGRLVTVRGLGESMKMTRTGDSAPLSSGPFAGVFSEAGEPSIWLNLSQAGDLLAGTGYVNGRAVAVTGKTTSPTQANGVLLFSDGSRMGVRAVLSGDGDMLTVEGLGGPIDMKRR